MKHDDFVFEVVFIEIFPSQIYFYQQGILFIIMTTIMSLP